MPRLTWKFFLFFGIIAIIFLLFPQLDIMISSLFFDGHFDRYFLPYKLVYDGVRVISFVSILTLLVLLTLTFFQKFFWGLTRKKLLFLILAVALGPGLVVNTVFKDNWGRARPVQIKEFGGKADHNPPLVISNACNKNCSFVCGHASAGFVFAALAFLYRRREKEIFVASLFAGALIGFVRIAQGGHFFSDVVFSFFFTYLTVRLLYYVMFKNSAESIRL